LILFLNHAFLFNQNLDFLSQNTSLLSEVIQSLSQIVNGIDQVFVYEETVSLIGSHVVDSITHFSLLFLLLIGIITFSFLVLIFGAMKFIHSSKDIHAVLNDDFINACQTLAISFSLVMLF
jgi:hypothetical protein